MMLNIFSKDSIFKILTHTYKHANICSTYKDKVILLHTCIYYQGFVFQIHQYEFILIIKQREVQKFNQASWISDSKILYLIHSKISNIFSRIPFFLWEREKIRRKRKHHCKVKATPEK